MRRLLPFAALLIAVVIVASAACWITMRMASHRPPAAHHADAHEWIHTQLGITPGQEEKLALVERRYDEERKHLGEIIRLANMELAQALLEDKSDSPRVQSTIARIHDAQGKLQQATLRHVFEMKPVLTPGQYEKLLNLTANALYEVDHAR